MSGKVDKENVVRTASEGATTKVAVTFAENPKESVTFAASVNVPVAEGVQFSSKLSEDAQPGGSP